MSASRARLRQVAQRLLSDRDKVDGVVSGLSLTKLPRSDMANVPIRASSITVIIQGSRRLTLGTQSFLLEEFGFLINALPLPIVEDTGRADGDAPYMAIELAFDLALAERVRSGMPGRIAGLVSSSVAMTGTPSWMCDCFRRMLEISVADNPDGRLVDLLQQEFMLRLLAHPSGRALHQLTLPGSHLARVYRAVRYIIDRFREPLVVADLATFCNWSPSSLHHQFRRLTTMTPLQYQQFLRLSQARHLLLTTQMQAGEVASHVGYSSANQFNREYRRLFGAPPIISVSVL
ncbi:helix-turn-helix domain-containing protein [Rhizobium sp. S152]|uniref:helix-turn-helix domain-containing protein n=1 Tax=Rhizobium sp. S152 TaxID=3055038 RepID=UPI0025AA1B6B|nr:helix-turn-helix domain-containing protein [Rhizobium sp. S152]MDM9628985.1 helix-turn-helix domain-containing protein [Rhizobium sp. S152]